MPTPTTKQSERNFLIKQQAMPTLPKPMQKYKTKTLKAFNDKKPHNLLKLYICVVN
jgi:hypothetical protein